MGFFDAVDNRKIFGNVDNRIAVVFPDKRIVVIRIICYYSARSYASAKYWIHFTACFGGVHAFSYNSTESEPV